MHKILFVTSVGVLSVGCTSVETDGAGGQGSTTSSSTSMSTGSTNSSSTAASGVTTSTSTGTGAGGCASYAFCEDFEAGNAGEVPPGWVEHQGWDQGGSRAVLTTDEKHGGAKALRSAIGTNGQYRIRRDLTSFGALATSHWGRIFYKVKTPVAMFNGYIHNTFVAFGHPDEGNGSESRVVDTVMGPQGTHQFLFNMPDDQCCASSSYDFTYDANWHCAEWHVDGATGSYQFFYDGAEVEEIAVTNETDARIDSFDSIIVGWINYQSPSSPNEGWFDDLALDEERIGCD